MEADEEELLKKRFLETAARAGRQGICLYTDFLDLAQLDVLARVSSGFQGVPVSLWGGNPACERMMARFGEEDQWMSGPEGSDFPITGLRIRPDAPKYAEKLGHRDCLGALIHLGIDRSVLGDIFVTDEEAYLFCEETIAPFLCENLTRIRHTAVHCEPVEEIPADALPRLEERCVNAASERLDVIVAAVYRLSRSQSQDLFRGGRIFVNGRTNETAYARPKEGDVISVRGFGRFLYGGVAYETKKGRYGVRVQVYV